MHKILEGLSLFQRIAYPRHRELFADLASRQNPQAIFITCSDSRVVPNLMVQADPGDLFIIRNAGNIVPAHGKGGEGMVASIEYAVEALGIRDIVLCGHSNCGAMKGILHPGKVAHLPSVSLWVSHAQAAHDAVLRDHPGATDDELVERIVEYNVMAQVRNLLTHPFIRKYAEKGEMELYGWVYDIASGHVRGLDSAGRNFVDLDAEGKGSPDEFQLLASLESDEEFWGKL